MPVKNFWVTFCACVLLAGGCWWWLRGSRNTASSPSPAPPSNIEWHLNHVRLHGLSGGKIVWEIDADNISLAKDRPLLTVHGVKRVALMNDGAQELTLSADTLERNTATGDIAVDGHVLISGNGLAIHTPAVKWDPHEESLLFPQSIATRLGEYQLTCQGVTRYNVPNGQLSSSGGLLLTLRGDRLSAGGIELNDGAFTLLPPVEAELSVADLTAWSQGRSLPAIPDIPANIRQRYQQYHAKQQAGAAIPVPRKGAQP